MCSGVMWKPQALDLPAVGSLSAGTGCGIGFGKAAAKDANAASRKDRYILEIMLDTFFLFFDDFRSCRVDYDVQIYCTMKINFKVERPALDG